MITFRFEHKRKKTSFDVEKILSDAPEGVMLIDSYECVVGTPMPQGYSELVLSTHAGDCLLLERWEDGGLQTEQHTSCLVPLSAARDAYEAIANAGMTRWESRKDVVALCGMSYVCKFRCSDGSYVRVGSGHMPEDGRDSFYAVRAALLRYYQ